MRNLHIARALCAVLYAIAITTLDCDIQGHVAVAADDSTIVFHNALVIGPLARSGRAAVHVDPIELHIVRDQFRIPSAGEAVTLADGSTRMWTAGTANDDGSLRSDALQGGYAHFTIHCDSDRVMILRAAQHLMVYVNGEPRAGDPYGYGFTALPVALHAGDNSFLFLVPRGEMSARLEKPRGPITISDDDATFPDILSGQVTYSFGAVVIVNATPKPLNSLSVNATIDNAGAVSSALPIIPPLSARKVAFKMHGDAMRDVRQCNLNLELSNKVGSELKTVDSAEFVLRVREPNETHKRTFVSEIDGSVQYYAVTPAKPSEAKVPPALVLTLHGASVEALGQASAYESKDWCHIVAPTNRRPYGFDWEDWGRLDAMEVLAIAQQTLQTDPSRTYLTGHSMGGHGAWSIGATFPDRFAAIGPSAGWVSFWSYSNAAKYENATPVEKILLRASSPSDTIALSANYANHGVFVLHGDADDNVPVEQARTMRKRLAEFHPDFVYHEQPGAGHWWGNACVDWPPMFEFFRQHTLPAPNSAAANHIQFITANPGISASCRWATIAQQIVALSPSSITLNLDPAALKVTGTTDNVARLELDLNSFEHDKPVQVELDGEKFADIAWPVSGWLSLRRLHPNEKWTITGDPFANSMKNPQRNGTFKDAFRHRVIFVYGTKGTATENAWSFAKARYDAETFWYRGNASVDVIADVEFDATAEPSRNVILYGNADTNAAWPAMLHDSPVQITRGGVRIGTRDMAGDELACLLIRPRPGSDIASVGVVGGTGPAGCRLTDRLPYFISGVAFPDCIVISTEALTAGTNGIRAAGFFGNDWKVEIGDFAWRD